MWTGVVLGCLALGSRSLPAANLPLAAAKDVGVSADKLRGVEQAVGEHLDQQHLAGAVTLVMRKGQIIHLEAHGWRNLQAQEPMTTDTIFRIYSMTKPIVSAALLALLEQGRFELDDPVQSFIPEFQQLTVYSPEGNQSPRRPMTVRDLMRHTAGLTYGFFGNTAVEQTMPYTRNLSVALKGLIYNAIQP